jgi:hypothetical protein
MTHPIDIILAGAGNTLGSEYWVKFDEAFMSFCSEIVVVAVEGWEKSSGISREMRFFERAGKRISFMQESEVEFEPALNVL